MQSQQARRTEYEELQRLFEQSEKALDTQLNCLSRVEANFRTIHRTMREIQRDPLNRRNEVRPPNAGTSKTLLALIAVVGMVAGYLLGTYLKLSVPLLLAPIALGACLTLAVHSLYTAHIHADASLNPRQPY